MGKRGKGKAESGRRSLDDWVAQLPSFVGSFVGSLSSMTRCMQRCFDTRFKVSRRAASGNIRSPDPSGKAYAGAAMDKNDVLKWLKQRGSRRIAEGLGRYGIQTELNVFGVSMGTLLSLRKQLGRDHAL